MILKPIEAYSFSVNHSAANLRCIMTALSAILSVLCAQNFLPKTASTQVLLGFFFLFNGFNMLL